MHQPTAHVCTKFQLCNPHNCWEKYDENLSDEDGRNDGRKERGKEGRKKGMTEGQGKCSITPLFQSRAIIIYSQLAFAGQLCKVLERHFYLNLMHFNPFISQIIVQIYTVKSFEFSSVTNKRMPSGIMDGWFSTVLEQDTYSGRSKVILPNASSTKFQLNPSYSSWDVENVKRWNLLPALPPPPARPRPTVTSKFGVHRNLA